MRGIPWFRHERMSLIGQALFEVVLLTKSVWEMVSSLILLCIHAAAQNGSYFYEVLCLERRNGSP